MNISGKIIVIVCTIDIYVGGYGSGYGNDEILKFNPLSGQWELVDRMIHARHHHAVSVIDYSEVAKFCKTVE